MNEVHISRLKILLSAFAVLLGSLTTSEAIGGDWIGGGLATTNEDRAATQGVFAPGPGFWGDLGNDWHIVVFVYVETPKIISSILVTHNGYFEAWTTTSRKWNGLDLYPLVVFKDGIQQNTRYDQKIGPITKPSPAATPQQLDLYAQIESTQFNGATVTVEFTDGSSVQGAVLASGMAVNPLNMATLSCADNAPVDSGYDPNVFATNLHTSSTAVPYTFHDNCIDSVRLSEGICGGMDGLAKQMVTGIHTCPVACKDGACVGGAQSGSVPGSVIDVKSFVRNEVRADSFH